MKKTYKKGRSMDIAFIFLRYFFETEYLHFGYWAPDYEVKFSNLKKAQELYVENLLKMIPAGVHSILEIGCGSGEMAKKLISLNYQVDVVSPSSIMTSYAQEKLAGKVQFNECTFEEFDTNKRYDLVLFSESFQFVKLETAIRKSLSCGTYVLVADVFKKDTVERSPIGGGHSYSDFIKLIKENNAGIVTDNDVTHSIAPQFDLELDVVRNFVKPLVSVIERMYKTSGFLIRSLIRMILFFNRKGLQKLREKHFVNSGNRDGRAFERFKYYRFILFKSAKSS
jgi:SAM-dependent methyltransferase